MANIEVKSKVDLAVNINLKLSIVEANALNALTVYGDEAFLEFFYKNLGIYYLKPHEKGLRSLFDTIKSNLPKRLREVEDLAKAAQNLNK